MNDNSIPKFVDVTTVIFAKQPLVGSHYSSGEQLHCSLHWSPKNAGGQVKEQFSPVVPGSHSALFREKIKYNVPHAISVSIYVYDYFKLSDE